MDRAPIRVAVRCKPSSAEEEGEMCVAVEPNGQIVVRSGEEEANFSFDACFGPAAAQIDVYTELVSAPMAALFDGVNCSIVTYGQTGSGKTFSLMGSSDGSASPATRVRTAGIVPRFCAELFDRLGKVPGASVSVSYTQLYNESFADLLEPNSAAAADLKLRRSETRGVHVAGLSEKRVGSAKELLQLLARADAGRANSSTEIMSARSHAILTLTLMLPVTKAGGAGAGAAAASAGGGRKVIMSRAHLVDLAGSERYSEAAAGAGAGGGSGGAADAISVNQSLTNLGLVIGTLASAQGRSEGAGDLHVPYRNSKLTYFLKEALGGTDLCVLLCTLTPSINALHETLSTLHFASRARAVVNTPARNAPVAAPSGTSGGIYASGGGASSSSTMMARTPYSAAPPSRAAPTTTGGLSTTTISGLSTTHAPEGFLASAAFAAVDPLLAHPLEGLPSVADVETLDAARKAIMQLRERLQQVGRAAETSHDNAVRQARLQNAELLRQQEAERERTVEMERLRWQFEQQNEREASRAKVSQLQDEVRNFKTASQHKLQAIEMQQLKERESMLTKKLAEAEGEVSHLRSTMEKRLADVEAARAKEMDVHERRIVKLMSVIEALTSAGDERTDMRVLAEKMRHLTEVKEHLEEEKSHVRTFHKRQRELHTSEVEAEREAGRRRVNELEAELKTLRSLSRVQVDEVSQAQGAELNLLRRRAEELEEEKESLKRTTEKRLGDERSQFYLEVQERERRTLSMEEAYKTQLQDARRETAEAAQQLQAAQARSAALQQQAQEQGRQLLLLQSGAKPSETLSLLAANTSSMSNDQLLELTLHREREAHRAEVRGLEEARDSLQAEVKVAADSANAKSAEHMEIVQSLKAEMAKERAAARAASEAERIATQSALSSTMSVAVTEAENRHVGEISRLREELTKTIRERDELAITLDKLQGELAAAQLNLREVTSSLKAEKKRSMDIEMRELEAAEAREAEIEAERIADARVLAVRNERAKATRARVAMKFFRGSQERVARVVMGSWARYTKVTRLGAARERVAHLIVAAEEIKASAEAQRASLARERAEHEATVGASIGAMRQDALKRAEEVIAKERELDNLHSQIEEQTEQIAAMEGLLERAAANQRRVAERLFSVHGHGLAQTAFNGWRSAIKQQIANRLSGGAQLAELESYEAKLAALEAKSLTQQEKMSRRILQQITNSVAKRLFEGWHRFASDAAARRRAAAELEAARNGAEAEQSRLLAELQAASEGAEEKEARKKEAMARRLLRGNAQRLTLNVLGAWRSWAAGEKRSRHADSLREQILAAEERAEQLRLQEGLVADAQKERLAIKVAKNLGANLLGRCYHAWHEHVLASVAMRSKAELQERAGSTEEALHAQLTAVLQRQSKAKLELVRRAFLAHQEQLVLRVFVGWKSLIVRAHGEATVDELADLLAAAEDRAKSAERRAEELSEQLETALSTVGMASEQIAVGTGLAEAVKLRLAEKLGMPRVLRVVVQGWHKAAVDARLERAAARREAERERLAIKHFGRALLGLRDHCFVAWRQHCKAAAFQRDEAKGDIKVGNLVERMQKEFGKSLTAKVLAAWRRYVLGDQQYKLSMQNTKTQAERDSMAGQLRLANAAREAEARRVDMVRSEARLEGTSHVSQLEARLRRAELDAQDMVRQAELKAEERRMAEARQHQLQLSELQSQLRLERLDRGSSAEKIREEVRQQFSSELRELDRLKREAAEANVLRAERDAALRDKEAASLQLQQASNEDVSLKQITKLSLQVSELQRELKLREAQEAQANQGEPSGGLAGGAAGLFGLFGGGGGGGGAAGSRRPSGNEGLVVSPDRKGASRM